MARQLDITFSINGYCEQTIELISSCPYTPEQVAEMLASGEAITTTQEGGEVVVTTDGEWTEIGVVVSSNIDGEYFDFELEDG